MLRSVRFWLFLLACCAWNAAGLAQAAPNSPEAAALADLKTATAQMQLESAGVPPFRLTADFATNDYMGRPDVQGKWTEEFASPEVIRRTLRDNNSPMNYAPEDREAMGAPPPETGNTFMRTVLLDAMLHPGPSDAMLEHSKVSVKEQKFGNLSLRCVKLEPSDPKMSREARQIGTRMYCLSAGEPMLRLAQVNFGIALIYNNLARYGGKLFAQQITAQQGSRTRGKLQLAKLVNAPELAKLTLPANENAAGETKQKGAPLKMGAGVAQGALQSKVAPIYPEEAKRKHITGSVMLHAIISKTGTIESLEVVSASAEELVESAIEAVSQWTYHPYTLNGQPTEVDTTITVNYRMG